MPIGRKGKQVFMYAAYCFCLILTELQFSRQILIKLPHIIISVFNQLDAQNLFHNKFYFMPLHVSSTCAHHQEVKIVYTASGIITPIGGRLVHLFIKLVKYWDKYYEMHGQQNVKIPHINLGENPSSWSRAAAFERISHAKTDKKWQNGSDSYLTTTVKPT